MTGLIRSSAWCEWT